MKQMIVWGKIRKGMRIFFFIGFCLIGSLVSMRMAGGMEKTEEAPQRPEKEEPGTAAWLREHMFRESITREEAAFFIQEYLSAAGEKFPENKIQKIIKYQRIRDLNQTSQERREALAGVYALGILTGESCGEYSHQRKIFPKRILSENEKMEIYQKTLREEKRTPISYDGQVIRTSNLPRQAKFYSYILESFPNAYYDDPFEMYFDYNRFLHKAGEDYFYPVQMLKKSMAGKVDSYVNSYGLIEAHEKYSCDWVEMVEKNLRLRLNFDYRTVDEKWMNELLNTYAATKGFPENRRKERKRLEEYVKTAKKNHIVIQGKASADMSSFYRFVGFKIRVHVKFCVRNADNLTPDLYDHENVIYGKRMSLHGLREGKWEESFFDFWLGSHGVGGYWENFGIMDDSFVRYTKPEHYRRPGK